MLAIPLQAPPIFSYCFVTYPDCIQFVNRRGVCYDSASLLYPTGLGVGIAAGETGVRRAADRVYDAVREEIIRGTHEPGCHLGEAMLAERFKVSRTPVRAALSRLESDGFITIAPHSGAVVATRSVNEVGEIFEVRAILESAAAGLAALRRTEGQVATLRELADAMEAEVARGLDVGRLSALNRDFHTVILAASGNPTLSQSAERLMALGFLTHTYSNFSDEDVHRSLADHRSLIVAIESGDERWAAAAMRSHILGASNTLRTRLARGRRG